MLHSSVWDVIQWCTLKYVFKSKLYQKLIKCTKSTSTLASTHRIINGWLYVHTLKMALRVIKLIIIEQMISSRRCFIIHILYLKVGNIYRPLYHSVRLWLNVRLNLALWTEHTLLGTEERETWGTRVQCEWAASYQLQVPWDSLTSGVKHHSRGVVEH